MKKNRCTDAMIIFLLPYALLHFKILQRFNYSHKVSSCLSIFYVSSWKYYKNVFLRGNGWNDETWACLQSKTWLLLYDGLIIYKYTTFGRHSWEFFSCSVTQKYAHKIINIIRIPIILVNVNVIYMLTSTIPINKL